VIGAGRVAAFAALVGGLAVSLVVGSQAAFAGGGGFPRAYSPEVAPFNNTFTSPTESLSPKCPQGIVGTPGSDPASLALNAGLSSDLSSGGNVHFVYGDDAHGSAFGFTIQICAVVYPASFFTGADFDPVTGVLINPSFSKNVLDSSGTEVDGASLSGISNPEGDIYFSWTTPNTVPQGSWVCSFARDVDSDHGGGGNRKVSPTCFQVRGSIQV
jgi:hypothetical protein